MIIACNQPNYIPWYPYFHLIKSVDKFFLLDVVKAGKKNFIVRNKILDKNNKEVWLTIPLKKEEKYKNICHTYIDENFKEKLSGGRGKHFSEKLLKIFTILIHQTFISLIQT